MNHLLLLSLFYIDTYFSIGANTSSPVDNLPVSTGNTVARTLIISSLYPMHVVVCFLLMMSPRAHCIWVPYVCFKT